MILSNSRTLTVTTGDVTRNVPSLRAFSIFSTDIGIRLSIDDVSADIDHSEWESLTDQVKTRSPTKWKYSKMPPPMGRTDMQRLLNKLDNTPSYQLFLAAFDIASQSRFISDDANVVIASRVESFRATLKSSVGTRGIFFVTDTLLTNASEAVSDLLLHNKLCRLDLKCDEIAISRYYIPYATPSAQLKGASQKLWDSVRQYYYSFR